MKKPFSSISTLNVYLKWGRVGLLLSLNFRALKYYLFGAEKSSLFSAGWHDPVAPQIIREAFGSDFRISDRTMNHAYSALTLSNLTDTSLDEDLYPLI